MDAVVFEPVAETVSVCVDASEIPLVLADTSILAAVATIILLVLAIDPEPDKASVPALTVVVLVYVFTPESVIVPVPNFVNPKVEPEIIPPTVNVLAEIVT